MHHISELVCFSCKKSHPLRPSLYICESCGANLEVKYHYGKIREQFTRQTLERNASANLDRYLPLLPINDAGSLPGLRIGQTPLYLSDRKSQRSLSTLTGLEQLYIKDDGRNPSASFKDRAGAIAIAHAKESGVKLVTGASTGNAASSMACLSATSGIQTVIFVPKTAPQAKIAQLLVFGSKVITVNGTYDDAFELCLKASAEYGWYNRNTGYNPYTREGKKTCSFEIIEQLQWQCPDWVAVSVGDGNIISGLWKGFKDFYELGLIKKLPKLLAVQAEGSNAVKLAFESGQNTIPTVKGDTVADSISVSIPRDGLAAVQAVRESGGFCVSVTDQEILSAIPTLAQGEGIFAEPAGATPIAGLLRLKREGKIGGTGPGTIASSSTVVTVITGNGLKDVASAMKSVGAPFNVDPSLDALKRLVPTLKVL